MKHILPIFLLLTATAHGADVVLGRISDLTWTGTGADRVASFGVADVTDGLVNYWPFTGDATDAIGNKTGVVNGAVLTNGVKGAAGTAYQTGTDQFIVMSNVVANFEAGTLSWWQKPEFSPTDGAPHEVFGIGNAPELSTIKWSDNNAYIGWYTGADDDRIVTSATNIITEGAWSHLVFAWTSNGTSRLYCNGMLCQSNTTATTPRETSTSYPMTVGRHPNTLYPFPGAVDQFRLYNRELTAAEVLAIYNLEKP